MHKSILITVLASIVVASTWVTASEQLIPQNTANQGNPVNFGEIDFPPLDGLLITGTAGNSAQPDDTQNGIVLYELDTGKIVFNAITMQTWGAAADPDSRRILFSVSNNSIGSRGGNELFALSYDGGQPVSLGIILDPNGESFRMDGLAYGSGVLYAVLDAQPGGGKPDGIYKISIEETTASLVMPLTGIGGIDTDPETGRIYGANDDTGMLVEIDLRSMSVTDIAPYPPKTEDFDSLAALPGLLYMVADQDQPIEVFDLKTNAYLPRLPTAFQLADTFSGAAIAYELPPPPPPPPPPPQPDGFDVIDVPALSTAAMVLLGLLVLISYWYSGRKRPAR